MRFLCQQTQPNRAQARVSFRAAALLSALFASWLGSERAARAECKVTMPEDPVLLELKQEAHTARTWRYVWTALNGGSAVLSVAAIPILPKSDRPDLILSAATSAVSGAVTWFWPLDVEADAAAAERSRCWTPTERRRDLLRLRQHSAEDEAERVRWPWHVGNFVSSLIPGSILWFGFHERLNGVLSVAGSFASGEIELLTQPTNLADHPAPSSISVAGPVLIPGGALLTYRGSW